MRRSCTDRIFLFLIALLTFYIGWYVINNFSVRSFDPTEELTYLHALGGSTPILQNKGLCYSNNVDLVIVIISSGPHFHERQAIRETWGSMSHLFNINSRRLFVVGYTYGSRLYKDLSNEARDEQDLLYVPVHDNSMTLKELHAYRWLQQNCPNVTFTFKTEDDLFVNTFILHELVHELRTNPDAFQNRYFHNISIETLFLAHINPDANTFLFGWAFQPGKPERNVTMGHYYVSFDEYPKDLYPRYCSSFGYLMDVKTRNLLAEEGLKDKAPFRFSDIFVTGILPERLNFICDVLPLTYYQGTTEECISIIRKQNRKDTGTSTSPLIVCSTGRHVAQNAFSDYYRMWTVLKYVYSDQMPTTKRKKAVTE